MSFIKSILSKIVSAFRKQEPVENKPIYVERGEIQEPQPMPTPKSDRNDLELIDESEWVLSAAKIIGSFEGNGVDWGNPVGNFDGAYLTCGLLGFTWKWNNQPPMILRYIKEYGEDVLTSIMPVYGQEYIRAAKLGENGGKSIVAAWSNGSYKLPGQIKSELNNFWSSKGMIKIQRQTIDEMMGNWGLKKMYETQSYFGMEKPKFEHLVYWMDQATLNGTGNTPTFAEGQKVYINDVIDFCRSAGGYNKEDLRKNGALWSKMILTSPPDEVLLWKMAYLRAIRSRSEFKGTVMNRRGTLALGKGYINESLRTYEWA